MNAAVSYMKPVCQWDLETEEEIVTLSSHLSDEHGMVEKGKFQRIKNFKKFGGKNFAELINYLMKTGSLRHLQNTSQRLNF